MVASEPADPSPDRAPAGAAADYPVVGAVVPDRSAVQSFPHGTVFVFDHDLRYTHVGGEVLTSLAIDRTAYVGMTLREMFDADAVAVREPAYRQALGGHNIVLDAPLGKDRILEMHLSPLFDATGSVTAVLGYSLDVTELRRDNQSLLDAQEQFRVAFDEAPIGMALATVEGMLYRVNSALAAILHADGPSLLGKTVGTFSAPQEHPGPTPLIAAVLAGEADSSDEELRWRRPVDDSLLWARVVCTLVRHADSRAPSHLIVQVSDITPEREQREQIEAAHAFQQAVLAASPDIIHVRDVAEPTVRWTSRAITSMLGYSDAQIATLGPELYDKVIPAKDRARFDAASVAAQGIEDGHVVQVRHRALHADGHYVWLSRRLTPFRRDEAGNVTQILGLSRDVTESVALEARLEHASLHDDLTGLPNRRLVHDRLRDALDADPDGTLTAVLFCDLDGFKTINDTHGHETGDEVLGQVAQRFTSVIREGDTVGRIGGDEFVIVVRVRKHEDLAQVTGLVADRARAAISKPLTAGGVDHCLGVSVGVALAGTEPDPDDLLRRADQAMYRAKPGRHDRRHP